MYYDYKNNALYRFLQLCRHKNILNFLYCLSRLGGQGEADVRPCCGGRGRWRRPSVQMLSEFSD